MQQQLWYGSDIRVGMKRAEVLVDSVDGLEAHYGLSSSMEGCCVVGGLLGFGIHGFTDEGECH